MKLLQNSRQTRIKDTVAVAFLWRLQQIGDLILSPSAWCFKRYKTPNWKSEEASTKVFRCLSLFQQYLSNRKNTGEDRKTNKCRIFFPVSVCRCSFMATDEKGWKYFNPTWLTLWRKPQRDSTWARKWWRHGSDFECATWSPTWIRTNWNFPRIFLAVT